MKLKKPPIILGISYGHGDSSAALVVDNFLVAAAEEERFSRIKHDASFPEKAIRYCLSHAKINPAQVQIVASAKAPFNAFSKKFFMGLKHPALLTSHGPSDAKINLRKKLKKMGIRGSHVNTEHHLAHLMSARYLGQENADAFLSIDGMGDFVSSTMGAPQGHFVKILNRVYFPHSLGFFYTALTHYLGFTRFGEEFKVMGLSSYGRPRNLEVMRDLIRTKEGLGLSSI